MTMQDTEKNFEADIEAWLTSAEGGWAKATDAGYRASIEKALDLDTLVDFVQRTQPKAWERFVRQSNGVHPAGAGYHQMGDTFYCWLKYQLSK